MIAKVLCFTVLVAVAAAQSGHGHGHEHHGYSEQYLKRHDGHAQEVKIAVKDKHGHVHHVIDYYNGHPKYEFGYKVEDKHTGDIKSQHETRDGDVVKGYYDLHDPHGNIRKVEYHADKKTGFQATVHQHGIKHVYGGKH